MLQQLHKHGRYAPTPRLRYGAADRLANHVAFTLRAIQLQSLQLNRNLDSHMNAFQVELQTLPGIVCSNVQSIVTEHVSSVHNMLRFIISLMAVLLLLR